MKDGYIAEKLTSARRSLMLPHINGEAESIMYAFNECSLVMDKLLVADVDDSVMYHINKLAEFMNTDGIENYGGKGTFFIKAESFTVDDKLEISMSIDSLATHFEIDFWRD